MELNEYQTEAFKTALPSTHSIEYMLLGLCNEAGEAAGKLKKVMRGDKTIDETKDALADELADSFWYIAGAATVLGVSLNELGEMNLNKLRSRQERGVIQGSGDTR